MAREWMYRGYEIQVNPNAQRYDFYVWLAAGHILAAGSYVELTQLIDEKVRLSHVGH